MSSVNEKLLEDEITEHLVAAGGYQLCKVGTSTDARQDFDTKLGLDTAELFAFVEGTQPSAWAKLVKAHGGNEGYARQRFAQRLAQQIDERGTVDVLRYGVRDQNVEIRLSYRKPAFGVAPELVAHYDANRLTVTRQLPYDPESNKTVDLCLFVNGIPVATAELKNHLTGQNIEHAIQQYRTDRDPKNVTLGRRALVHFAVDPDAVAMTTKLEGKATRFLPFNRGHNLGKGNPPNPHGHKTSYLWERVWARDAWLDILHRFLHVDRPSKGAVTARRAAEVVIFPRFHQWDAVLKLEANAAANGPGQAYLIQHSAGSGKSNTIAWTAHRLSTVHDAEDRKVFDKIVVITDRVILDRQLQDTIYQFEHAWGLVVKIDKDSTQLAEALAGEQAKIIITTLQKFPFVLDKIGTLPSRNYAIIIDEAHSSQSGEAAKDLRLALGAGEEQELTAAEAEDAGLLASAIDPVEEALAKSVAARSIRQPNLSYFAFTATPKGRTLEMFGHLNPETNVYEPFHLYSMRQAIEEGFIMDVLANYTTYQTFWKIERATLDDPEYDARKARRAIARFVSLHPYQLTQKAEIIVEHFRNHTAKEMGGLAKAMVVTSSRLHAVRYKQAIDKYVKAKGYDDVRTLVAFSGSIDDGTGIPLTEANMNGFPESRTAEEFATPNYGVLIVAEKFQTGFDQPLLHTMYVDKVLVKLAAVQTLSRLNRIHPLKENTFVLDFRNDTDTIVEAFEDFHGCTVAPPTDLNILSDTRRRLNDFDVLRPDEVEAAIPALLGAGGPEEKRSAEAYAALAPAKSRFEQMGDEQRLEFRDALTRFVRTYSFVSQIAAYTEARLERDYVYCRALSSYLRDVGTAERLDLGAEVELTHLRNQMTFTGSLTLQADVGEVRSFYGEGRGIQHEPEMEHLSSIIEVLNDRFGTDLTAVDKLLLDQFEESWVADSELADQARNNSLDNFRLAFDRKFLQTIVTRVDANEEIFKKILDDQDFQATLGEFYLRKVYERLQAPGTSATSVSGPSANYNVDTLAQLADLHQQGVVSDDEFQRAKEKLLGLSGPPGEIADGGGDTSEPRQRYLKGQCPESIPVGKPFSLLASIVLAAAGRSSEKLAPFSVPAAGRDVLLVLHAPGLQVLSEQRQTVRVPPNADSKPVMFELRADTPGPWPMSITAWIGGSYLGELLVEITAERDGKPGPHRDVLAEIASEPTEGAVSLVVRFDPNQNAYRFEFRDEDNPAEVISNLAYDPGPLVEHLVADLDDLTKGRSGYSAAQARDYLMNAGAGLWNQLVPAQLREQFWDRQQRIQQLTILTDKDAVPWELLYPMDSGHDTGFLVEQFPVTRAIFQWRPARTLNLRPTRFVLPEGSLPQARAEIDAMRRLLDPEQLPGAVISALTPLQDLIRSGDFGLLHFACHNTYDPAGGSFIKLGDVQFTPTLMTTAVINQVLKRSAPTVFINACRSAGLAPTYNRLDGWASKFLEAGAAAFIGSLWAVSDGAAREFAQEFYGQLQAGSPLGKAAMQARQVAASQRDDPTWLAYSVYGDPRATIGQRL